MHEVMLKNYSPVAKNIPYKLFGKSGTAEENKNRANHANFICFSYDENNNPDLVVSTVIPYGYTAANAAILSYYAMCEYYDIELPTNFYYDIYSGWNRID